MEIDVVNSVAKGRGSPLALLRLYCPGQTMALTADEIFLRATATANYLTHKGIRPGDHVGIYSRNRLRYILLDLACIQVGAIFCALDPLKQFDLQDIKFRYGFRLLFTEGPAETSIDLADIEILPPQSERLFPAKVYGDDDTPAIKFTSGTTGNPKGIAARAASINSSINEIQALFQHSPEDRVLLFLPLSLLQQRYWIYSALVYGFELILTTPAMWLTACKNLNPTVIMGVPGVFEEMRREVIKQWEKSGKEKSAIEIQKAVLGKLLGNNIRYLWSGSAPASRELIEFYHERDMPLYHGYGSNEACIVAKNHPGAYKPGSSGKLLPSKSVSFDADGQIYINSKQPVNVRYQYFNSEEDQLIFQGNTIKTGDIGYLDEDGFLYVTGRYSDFFKLDSGLPVHPEPIEQQLKHIHYVTEAIVAGEGRPFPCALIFCSDPDTTTDKIGGDLEKINAHFSKEKRIRKFRVLPMDENRKSVYFTNQNKPIRRKILQDFSEIIDGIYNECK